MKINLSKKRIILSKTNRIGDVIVALPVAAMLKKMAPDCHIIMLVTQYTLAIAKNFIAVDECVAWDDPAVQKDPVRFFKTLQADIIVHLRANKYIAFTAMRAGIPQRIGQTSRIYNWFLCNKLVSVNRKPHSPYHDAQLDMQYISSLTQAPLPSLDEIAALMQFRHADQSTAVHALIDPNRFNLIIHPKSVTDAGKREWSLSHFAEVIAKLDPTRFKIFISGTESDGNYVRKTLCDPFPNVTDLTGKLSLEELIQFIQAADGLLGGSTGPTHIAAAYGIHVLGLYTQAPGHHPARWAPVGLKATYLVSPNKPCPACLKKEACECINEITSDQVLAHLLTWKK